MKNALLFDISSYLKLAFILLFMVGCNSIDPIDTTETIVIGTNLELTGDLPEVGKASMQAIEMYLEQLDASGGLEIGGESYNLLVLLLDNESTAAGSDLITTELVSDENVLAMIGPNTSYEAVPSGQIANDGGLVMISPWSTNVQTTLNRPWVFRTSFIDSFQGMAIAQFAKTQYGATNACVLYADDNAYPEGLAVSFENEWVNQSGIVVASETFQTGDEDLTVQLTNLKNANCDLIFLPQYANEVPPIILQAHDMDINVPFVGGDAWSNQSILDECGSECEGFFFSKQFVASGATGSAATFVSDYQNRFQETPDDVEALTWDAMLLLEQALKNCGTITGDSTVDRTCIRDGLASIQDLEGVTGPITLDENGDPQKCASFIQIENGSFNYFDSVCPE